MKVNYILHSSELLASHRYRASAFFEPLRRRGHQICTTEEPLEDADTYVFMKHWQEQDLARAGRLKLQRKRIVFDVTDDHFDRPAGPFYKKMISLASAVTCPTKEMQQRIKAVADVDAFLVQDPALFPLKPPRRVPSEPRLLWFGHAQNYPALQRWARSDSWLQRQPVTVVSNIRVTPALLPTLSSKWTYLWWEPSLVESLVDSHHVVLLPTMADSWAQTKSPNRLAEALQSGLWPVTHDGVPSYDAFRPYCWFGEPSKGVTYAINRPGEALAKVRAGQEFVQQYHSLAQLTLKWEKIFAG